MTRKAIERKILKKRDLHASSLVGINKKEKSMLITKQL